MNIFKSGLVAVAAMSLLATQAVAQSPVGSWKGKLTMDMSSMPKAQDPQAQKMIEAATAMIAKMGFNLTLKADHTYKMEVTGQPQAAGKDNSDTGKWSQSGRTITVTSSNKARTDKKPQTLTLSADGKKLTLTLPSDAGAKGAITFTKS